MAHSRVLRERKEKKKKDKRKEEKRKTAKRRKNNADSPRAIKSLCKLPSDKLPGNTGNVLKPFYPPKLSLQLAISLSANKRVCLKIDRSARGPNSCQSHANRAKTKHLRELRSLASHPGSHSTASAVFDVAAHRPLRPICSRSKV